ncbi:hypothetical protein RDV64_10445 [Acuticoccus sp. MNP-M23]|uniref:hypothetical protein n=1 Tax=Acuticoccus sp. MNP-M23 TaxID=3072793 RepID=UPI0028162E38|nr:hypothetical protein [Acuticoccus sp. MNP-M23]WMS44766.1 hypothetical protein RDV64_10445 [Acuticoccus sp. MNP-M23]
MTDFYSVLQRAVSSLPESSGPNRRAVYDKARKALLKQLQSFDPPLPSSDVTSQRLALEDAIRKIENEIARQIRTQRALQSSVPGGVPRSRAIAPAAPGAPDVASRAAEEERLAQRAAEAERARRHNAELLQAAVSEATAAPEPDVLGPPSVPATQDDAMPDLAEAVGDEVMFESESDYDRERVEEPHDDADDGIVDGEYDEVDPNDDEIDDEDTIVAVDPKEDKRQRREEMRAQREEERRQKAERRSARKNEKKRARAPVAAPRADRKPRKKARHGGLSRAVLPILLLVLLAGAAFAAYTQRETLLSVLDELQEDPAASPEISVTGRTVNKNSDRLPSTLDGEDTRAVTTTTWPPTPPATDGTADTPVPDAGRTVGADVTPFAPDGAATDAEDQVSSIDASGSSAAPEPAAEPETDTAAEDAPEAETEVAVVAPPPSPVSTGPVSDFTPTGSQTAVLYEEAAQAGERGQAVAGAVEWSMVRQSIGGGEPEPVVRAVSTIPDRDITTTVTIRENQDGALPASHLIEIAFDLPEGFEGGEVNNVPGLIMKESEQSRGEALRGAAARVSSGLFWIALSENETDRENNLRLLRERDWIDIPILFDSDRRAILTLRKGSDGLQSIDAAIQAWDQN